MAVEFRLMQQRRGTEAQWAANDVVLLAGELGLQMGPGTGEIRMKVGTGSVPYSELPFVLENDPVARGMIASAEGQIVSLDSRVLALEEAVSGGGSLPDLAAQVQANTEQIDLRQMILPVGLNPGDITFWDGTAFDTTGFAPPMAQGGMFYWDAVAQAYLPIAGGAPGQVLGLSGLGVPSWITNVASGVPDAPSDGVVYGRRDAAWVTVPLRPSVVAVATTTHQPALGIDGRYFRCTDPAGCEVTIPTNATEPFPIGTTLTYEQVDAGPVTFVGDGPVLIRFAASRLAETAEQYAAASIIKVDTNEWVLSGSLAEAP